jgi:Dihydrofolate reductase
MIAIIAAYAKNSIIGNKGQIPWDLSGDRKRFRELTTGSVVIMGRKTYESIGKRLPGRLTIVLSRTKEFTGFTNICTKHSLRAALAYAAEHADLSDVFIAGGAAVYKEAIPLCDVMYVTEIDAEPAGDVYFPPFNTDAFTRTDGGTVTEGTVSYRFVTFTRKDGRRVSRSSSRDIQP